MSEQGGPAMAEGHREAGGVGFSVLWAGDGSIRIEARTGERKTISVASLDQVAALRDALSSFLAFHQRQFGVPGAVRTPEGGAAAQPDRNARPR